MKIDIKKEEQLMLIAKKSRIITLKMIFLAQSGHSGSSLGLAEILVCLYFNIMNINPENPNWGERDRLILSKGHACPILYTMLALRGYFTIGNLRSLRRINSILQGHPDLKKTPGIDMTTGSLGAGLSIGVGMALSAKLDKKDYKVFVIMGDGEINEGTVWEAAMAANKFKLNNLIGILERNHLQLDGNTEEIMPLEPLNKKWLAFNWDVIEIDGHNVSQIIMSLNKAKKSKNKPTLIISHTIKGKGVSFMENRCEWHGKVPDAKELKQAIYELKEINGKIK